MIEQDDNNCELVIDASINIINNPISNNDINNIIKEPTAPFMATVIYLLDRYAETHILLESNLFIF